MDWLTSLPVGLLVVGWVGFMLLIAFASRLAIRTIVPADEHDDVQRVAAPLMPALGAAFGVLIGLTLASEAGYLKSAQDVVADEAAAASRLAWAATSPGVQSQPIHDALGEYLLATRTGEWRGAGAEEGDPRVAEAIASLEQVVRAEAARSELGTPASTELLASLDAVTSTSPAARGGRGTGDPGALRRHPRRRRRGAGRQCRCPRRAWHPGGGPGRWARGRRRTEPGLALLACRAMARAVDRQRTSPRRRRRRTATPASSSNRPSAGHARSI